MQTSYPHVKHFFKEFIFFSAKTYNAYKHHIINRIRQCASLQRHSRLINFSPESPFLCLSDSSSFDENQDLRPLLLSYFSDNQSKHPPTLSGMGNNPELPPSLDCVFQRKRCTQREIPAKPRGNSEFPPRCPQIPPGNMPDWLVHHFEEPTDPVILHDRARHSIRRMRTFQVR